MESPGSWSSRESPDIPPSHILIAAHGISVTPTALRRTGAGNGAAGDPAEQRAGPQPALFRMPRGKKCAMSRCPPAAGGT